MALVKSYNKLRIKQLGYISAVDAGAQGPISNVALIKSAKMPLRKGKPPTIRETLEARCKVIKTDAKLGIVFGWAMAGTVDGGKTPHVDHQKDAIEVNSDEFLKVCVDFMEKGAKSDVMHDCEDDGRVVFAMPLTREINAALGIQSDVEGFAIGMKPSAATFKRFESGELGAFSIYGLGEREAVVETDKRKSAARRTAKQVLLTSIVDGHQHAIDLDDPASWCGDSLSTTYGTSEGAEGGHSHVWTFDDAGKVTIGMDSGHDHTVDGVVPADVLAVFALNERAEDTQNVAAVMERVLDGEVPAGSVSVTIAARNPALGAAPNSTQPGAVAQGGSHKTEKPIMNLAKMLATFLAMSATSRDHVAKMVTTAPDELDGFFAKSTADREAIAKAAHDADPVVFTGELTGLSVRKSDGDIARKMAEQAEVQAKANRDLSAEIAVTKATSELTILKGRAKEELGNLAGTDDVKVAVLKAIGTVDEKLREDALKLLKGANAIAKGQATAPGNAGEGNAPAELNKRDSYTAFEKGLITFCTEKQITKVWTEGHDKFVATPAGQTLWNAYEAAKAIAAS